MAEGDTWMGTTTEDEHEDSRNEYGRAVGERLRLIRRQKRLSLQEVEAVSDQEFKASVLGAYERGERAISVPRLHRLAQFYKVPVDQLLPEDHDSDILRPIRPNRGPRSTSPGSKASRAPRPTCSTATCA